MNLIYIFQGKAEIAVLRKKILVKSNIHIFLHIRGLSCNIYRCLWQYMKVH